ncbi:HIT family protein [Candidatus Woesearchaeota archaeon]|nr:HIT family protein [Candidatus Woesearchaeota archaeon]
MAKCDYCEIAESGTHIYEDDRVVVALSPEPASLGHVLVLPKDHLTILEQVPDFLAGHLFSVANAVSTSIFETLRVHGTNIIIENGLAAGQKIAHFAINIIPRSENDGMGFNWAPKRLSEDDLSTIELQLKEQTRNIGGFQKNEKKPLTINDEDKTLDSSEGDYMMRQLDRLP